VRVYRTGLWDGATRAAPRPSRGRRFAVQFSSHQFEGSEEQYLEHRKGIDYPPNGLGYLVAMRRSGDKNQYRFGGEALIFAKNRLAAQRRLHLINSAKAVFDGSLINTLEYPLALPFSHDDLEDLQEYWADVPGEPGFANVMTQGVETSCRIACKASWRRYREYALHKLHQSYRSASVHLVDTHPRWEPKLFGVVPDTLDHVQFGSAITLAYSAIEELQLEIRSSAKKPFKLTTGAWNPVVQTDLENRLTAAGVDHTRDLPLIVRGTPTKIERQVKTPRGKREPWSRGPVVRDSRVSLIDALQHARWLRNKVTSHRFGELSGSLTIYDVVNVQLLARRLVLEHLGFLPVRQ